VKLPIVTTYSNLQLRLGYLKVLAAVGDRSPTTQESFERKLQPLFPPPPLKANLLGKAGTPPPADASYMAQMFSREKPKRRGLLNRNNLHELIILGKAFQFLHPVNCSLYEISVVLRAIMGPAAIKSIADGNSNSAYNPMTIGEGDSSRMERAFFFLLILSADLPTALIACVVAGTTSFHLQDDFKKGSELVEGDNAVKNSKNQLTKTVDVAVMNTQARGAKRSSKPIVDESLTAYSPNNILLKAYNLIARTAGNELSITNWREWKEYFEGAQSASTTSLGGHKAMRMGKQSSFRHHAAPRIEFLVDLHLLDLSDTTGEDGEPSYYAPNDNTRRFESFFNENFLTSTKVPKLNLSQFLRSSGMKCFAATYQIELRDPTADEPLQFLLQSYQTVKREIGTTPMWTTALMASLLALDAGVLLETEKLYSLASSKAQEERAAIRLSGGSRFDGEFLIGISPELLKTVTKPPSS